MSTAMTQHVARLLLLPIFMIALAVVVKGYADTGDGFAAGVIAALGVLLQYLAFGHEAAERMRIVRYAPLGALLGLFLALLLAFVPVLFGEPVLTHLPRVGEHAVHFGTLEFITPALFDVGVLLVVYGFAVGAIGAIARSFDGEGRR